VSKERSVYERNPERRRRGQDRRGRRSHGEPAGFRRDADNGPEVSERLIAEALYPYPENLVIATKGGLVRPGPGQWVPNGRQHEAELKRLGRDNEFRRYDGHVFFY
jgi:hypothetical protein